MLSEQEAKIRRIGWTVNGRGCWIWNASCTKPGYPQMRWNGTMVAVHRVAYLIWNGPIMGQLVVRHTCDTPACINPSHLILGTRKDNAIDWTRRAEGGPKKLSNDDVAALRELASAGARTVDLAHRFGVRPEYVSRIRTGSARRWIT